MFDRQTETVVKGTVFGLAPQIQPQLVSLQYPLINYLDTESKPNQRETHEPEDSEIFSDTDPQDIGNPVTDEEIRIARNDTNNLGAAFRGSLS